MKKQYIFGPVASRRLGISLGVDLVPHKTCPLNCVYCEARETTCLTMERKEYVPVDTVLAELDDTLKSHPQLDYITFSGSGEPTLNSRIGDVVTFVKQNYPEYKVCLLTNGLLLGDPELQQQISRIDLLVPSLDASCSAEYEAINRPTEEMPFDRYLNDMTAYLRIAPMPVYLELFIIPGINDSDESIERFARIISNLKIDRIQLNTLDRPGAVEGIPAAGAECFKRFIDRLKPLAMVEAVGKFRYRSSSGKPADLSAAEQQIMDLISRRPATLPDLALATGTGETELEPLLKQLFDEGRIGIEKQERGIFYLPM